MNRASAPSSVELRRQLVHTKRELHRWELKHGQLHKQLAQLTPPTHHPPPPAPPTASAGADSSPAPPPKRRVVVTPEGLERTIGELKRKRDDDEHKDVHDPSTSALSPSSSTTPPGVPVVAMRERNRRMFAGLLSHLVSAKHTETPTERAAHSHLTAQRTDVQRAVERCEEAMRLLRRKEDSVAVSWMRRVRDEGEERKADWFWTREDGDDGGRDRVAIAWRPREMSETWRVVMQEEAKERSAAAAKRPRDAVGVPDVAKWTDSDEHSLQELIEGERTRDSDAGPHRRVEAEAEDASRSGSATRRRGSGEQPARRGAAMDGAAWRDRTWEPRRRSDEGSSSSGKRRRDDDDEYYRDGGRPSSGDSHEERRKASTPPETEEERLHRETQDRARDDEAERLLNGI